MGKVQESKGVGLDLCSTALIQELEILQYFVAQNSKNSDDLCRFWVNAW